MKNVTLDRTTVLQLDANGTDSALDATADCNALRNDVALDLCAIADQEIRGAQLAFDSRSKKCPERESNPHPLLRTE